MFRRSFVFFAILTVGTSTFCAADATQVSTKQIDCDANAEQQILISMAPESILPARAIWLSQSLLLWPDMPTDGRYLLYGSEAGKLVASKGDVVRGASAALQLQAVSASDTQILQERFRYVGHGVILRLASDHVVDVAQLLHQQLLLVQEDASGHVLAATGVQMAGALDDRFGAAKSLVLGVHRDNEGHSFRLWAPTAQHVQLCLYPSSNGEAIAQIPMQFDANTGSWLTHQAEAQAGRYYRYLVDVFVPGTGIVRNLVTDPYSLSLSANSQRSYIADLDSAALKPSGWDTTHTPRLGAQTDLTIYELHVRDFSANDASVPPAHRGKYLAFTDTTSNGMRHLKALAEAGITDVHLLPIFDLATVPELGCLTPTPTGTAADSAQQELVSKTAADDCYNWGYEPFHYGAPEGSYASDPADGAVRIREVRQMVQALHRAGLRVGMDLVYNHTSASGQSPISVLDRIVPGYYQRLDANGKVETSTCCANTATEHMMMAKLMIDTAVIWARDYHIDSFRFDLMGHQPRSAMEALQTAVDRATGRHIALIGEGWNFGEVANNQRFVQASQLSLNDSSIGTFSDRARDAVRGGSAGDNGLAQITNQGYINGLFYAPNARNEGLHSRAALLRSADMVRVGLAGSLRSYRMQTFDNQQRLLAQIDYAGQPAGYVIQPGEVVNYVENHDNQTLFDLNVFRLPVETSSAERARVQTLANATVAFSQGIAYFHAGQDLLRSKSMDRNSFDSGDWFNRIDWSYQDNYFGTGLPPQRDNGDSWELMRPLLANPAIRPTAADIAWTRDTFRDLLRIRTSTSLFRLRSADDINQRLHFYNTGSTQQPTVLVGHLDGAGYPGANFKELLYLLNVDVTTHEVVIPEQANKHYRLHPVHRSAHATDKRAADESRYLQGTGRFTVPARTAVVFVVE